MFSFLYNLIVYPLYQIIEIFYLLVYKIFKNSGYAVIGVSVAVTFLCLPLYIIAEKWQEKEREKQKEMEGQINRIKAVFKGDEQYMILSTFYKQNHYHPLMALRSSFGLLIQIPFFMAAYSYLSNLGELKGLSFLFIKDMGAPDATFHIGSFAVNILPIAMTLINCISGAIYTKGLKLRDKLQVYGMAAVFLVILYDSPAGLVVYWTMNNIFSMVKNIFYKLKNPLKVLYICLCSGVLFIDYYLLFCHHGFLYRRIMLICALSIVFISPLLIKLIKKLIHTVLEPIFNNKNDCLFLFFSSISVLIILIGLYIPSNVISSSPVEFSYIDDCVSPFVFLKNSLYQMFGFLLFWCSCIYFLFGKGFKTILSSLMAIFAISALINRFIFISDYGLLSPILNFSSANLLKAVSKTNLINLSALFIVMLLILFIIKFKKVKFISYFYSIICVSLILISGINCVKINKGFKEAEKVILSQKEKPSEISPIFNLSKTEKNVFVIMLDRAVNAYVPQIFKEKPELNKIYEGFVYYPNTISYGDHTLIGAPPLFGGYEYTPININKKSDISLLEKHNESLLLMPELFLKNGFDVTVTDSSWANYSWIPDLRIYDGTGIKAHNTIRTYTDIWLKNHPESSSGNARSKLMKRNFIWYGFMLSMPTMFRDSIYNDGFYWNTDKSLEDLQDVVNNYAALDYLPEFTATTNSKSSYTFMVNELTHEPAFLQAPDYTPSPNVTDFGNGPYANEIHYHANIAALLKVGEWIEYLKENDVYNNTRIIIVSDHGVGVTTDQFENNPNLPFRVEAVNPILLVKDFDSHDSFKVDYSFMTNADVPFLSSKDLISKPVNPQTNEPVKLNKENGAVIINSHLWSPDGQNKNTFKIADDEYFWVKDNIFDVKNWKNITKEEAYKIDNYGVSNE